MSLQTKYQPLIDAANQKGVSSLEVKQEEGVMYINGNAPNESVKKELWDVYNSIDPDYRSGDLILNIHTLNANTTTASDTVYEVKQGDTLSKIGEKYGVSWKDIYEHNKDVIKNPDLIYPGEKLKIPSK